MFNPETSTNEKNQDQTDTDQAGNQSSYIDLELLTCSIWRKIFGAWKSVHFLNLIWVEQGVFLFCYFWNFRQTNAVFWAFVWRFDSFSVNNISSSLHHSFLSKKNIKGFVINQKIVEITL